MPSPVDAFADIRRTLTNRGVILAEDGEAELLSLYEETIGPFLDQVIAKGVDVWTDPEFQKFPLFVLDIVTYGIAAEARHITRDGDIPTSPITAKVINMAAISVMQRQAVRDTCAYHIEEIIKKVGPLDRTKACGPYFLPKKRSTSGAATA